MAKKVSEKVRKEILRRLAGLKSFSRLLQSRWYIIARDERESVEMAFLRIVKKVREGDVTTANEVSDDGATYELYNLCTRMRSVSNENIKWLKKNGLFMGSKFHLTPEEEKRKREVVNCTIDIKGELSRLLGAIRDNDIPENTVPMLGIIKRNYGQEIFDEASRLLGFYNSSDWEETEVDACIRDIESCSMEGKFELHQADIAYIQMDYGPAVFAEACRRLRPPKEQRNIDIVNCIADIGHAVDVFEEATAADNVPDLNTAMDKIKDHYGDEVFHEACKQTGCEPETEVEACIEDINQAIDIFEIASLSADNKPDLNAAMDKIKESYGEAVFVEACKQSGLSKRSKTEVDDAEVQACVDEINNATQPGARPTQDDLARFKVDYGDKVFFQACRRLDLGFSAYIDRYFSEE